MREWIDRFYTWIALVLGIIVIALAWGLWHEVQSRPTAGGPSIEATPAPEVKHAPTKRVATAPVRAYSGAKAKLKLPPEVVANPDQEVVAASRVKPDPRSQTVTTVIDTKTGEATSYVKVDPYPTFAIEARGTAQLAFGYKFRDALPKAVVRATVSYDVVRVKAMTVGVTGSVDSDGEGFAGVSVTYRW